MSKRRSLDTLEIATQAKSKAAGHATTTRPDSGTLTTAIHIPRRTWALLRSVAFKRAQTEGGRASVSSLIVELVERHRGELEQESAR